MDCDVGEGADTTFATPKSPNPVAAGMIAINPLFPLGLEEEDEDEAEDVEEEEDAEDEDEDVESGKTDG